MEELKKAAMGYYNSLPQEKRALFSDFFNALDRDGDGTVSLSKFKEFLDEKGITVTGGGKPAQMFKMFDQDRNGTLDFGEVVTFFYYLSQESGGAQKSIPKRGKKKGKWAKAHDLFDAIELAFCIGTSCVGTALLASVATSSCSIM